jgi:hypothetical protein
MLPSAESLQGKPVFAWPGGPSGFARDRQIATGVPAA